MKHILLALTAVFTLASAPLLAQTAQAGAGASAGSNSASGAQSASVLYLDQRTGNGTATLKTAPPVSAPSMGSGHPCGLSMSGGISIIGGGASAGSTYVDEACLLAQMGQGEAALIMIAKRDGDACRALRQVGRIASTSVCDGDPKQPRKSTKSTASAKPALAVKCTKANGVITPRVTQAVADAYTTAQIKAKCRG